VIAHPDRIGHRRQRRIHRANAGKETGVDDIEIVELMGLAVRVEHGGFRIVPEPACARLVRDSRDPDVVLHIDLAVDQGIMHAKLAEHRF
jgi:hypothetical protein